MKANYVKCHLLLSIPEETSIQVLGTTIESSTFRSNIKMWHAHSQCIQKGKQETKCFGKDCLSYGI